jgi:hypothetical protein
LCLIFPRKISGMVRTPCVHRLLSREVAIRAISTDPSRTTKPAVFFSSADLPHVLQSRAVKNQSDEDCADHFSTKPAG